MNSKNLHIKALKYSKDGQYSKAISEFDRILLSNPKNAEVLSDRGVARFHLNDIEGALTDLNKALELEPENPYRYASRAYLRERAGDTNGAIQDYRKALELEPENDVTHNNLGLLEEKLGYIEMASNRFKLADRLSEIRSPGSDIKEIIERDKIIGSLLTELNIPIEENEEIKRSTIMQMLQIFISKRDRNDFFNYLKRFLRFKK